MNVSTKMIGNIAVTHLVGEIDTVDSDDFAGALSTLVAANPASIVLDFSEVTFIASIGLSLLVKLTQQMRMSRGKVMIASVSPAVLKVLETVHMQSIIPIKPSVDAALTSLGVRTATAA